MNSPNKALIRGGGIDEGTQEAAEPEFLDEYQKINDCETDECKTTLGCKLPVKYMCHVVQPRDKNDYNLNYCYKRYLQNALVYNVKSVAFLCGTIDMPISETVKWH